MKKLKLKTKKLSEKNLEIIKNICAEFPELITEINRNGKLIKTIDVDKLKDLIGDIADNDEEVYELTWAGKQKSKQKIIEPTNKTLRPIIEDSVDFENTENLYLEGDNFEILKILQESYLNKIKMIYIDPPYNTGKDFIYKDNFKISKEEYIKKYGISDNNENKLIQNTESNGRFHSDWLSMIYERLALSKQLLRDDGVIFISIDDNELYNLKKICDEVFGENAFIANFIRKTGVSARLDAKRISIETDYILCYGKSIDDVILNKEVVNNLNSYPFSDDFESERGKYKLNKLDRGSITYSKSLDYPIKSPDGTNIYPGSVKEQNNWCWRWSKSKLDWGIKNNFIKFKKSNKGWQVYFKQYQYVDNQNNKIERANPYKNLLINGYNNELATKETYDLFEKKKYFDYPKPTVLIKQFLNIVTTKSDIILDFFSGSATTAHAVMQLNAEDNGNRKFIMVQLPEKTDKDSEAYKAGYKNICEIGKERIRRAAKKIKDGYAIEKSKQTKLDGKTIDLNKLDFGFKVFKLDSSNMKNVYYNPNEIDQRTLINLKDNIKEDRTDKDLLYQVLLDLAIPISAKVQEKKINEKTIYIVNDDFLIACFEDEIDLETIKQIAELNPLRIVFKDSSFKDDATKVNCDEYLKNKLSNTIVKVI